jgi:hypothetical protein
MNKRLKESVKGHEERLINCAKKFYGRTIFARKEQYYTNYQNLAYE